MKIGVEPLAMTKECEDEEDLEVLID